MKSMKSQLLGFAATAALAIAPTSALAAQGVPTGAPAGMPAGNLSVMSAVASFYDQFHLEPVGSTHIEVCTNVSCALVGAQQVLEAFESELGIHAGETSEDGEVTLRTVERAGGCGWGTVVALNHRYRERVAAADVPAIVEEIRRGG